MANVPSAILLVDQNPDRTKEVEEALRETVQGEALTVVSVESVEKAMSVIRDTGRNLRAVLSSSRFGDGSGLEVVRAAKGLDIPVEKVAMFTADEVPLDETNALNVAVFSKTREGVLRSVVTEILRRTPGYAIARGNAVGRELGGIKPERELVLQEAAARNIAAFVDGSGELGYSPHDVPRTAFARVLHGLARPGKVYGVETRRSAFGLYGAEGEPTHSMPLPSADTFFEGYMRPGSPFRDVFDGRRQVDGAWRYPFVKSHGQMEKVWHAADGVLDGPASPMSNTELFDEAYDIVFSRS